MICWLRNPLQKTSLAMNPDQWQEKSKKIRILIRKKGGF